MMPDKFYHDQPQLPWQPNLRLSYRLAYIRDISELLASIRRFSGRGYRMMSVKFPMSDPGCHGNEIWDK